jgi:two-component system cell cycle sensor histidine kinase/response regulator CckA
MGSHATTSGSQPEDRAQAEADARRSALLVAALLGAAGVAFLVLPDALLDVGTGLLLRDALFVLIAAALIYALVLRQQGPPAEAEPAPPAPPQAEGERRIAADRSTAHVAHDLNNVLTAIGGYAELALARPELDEVARQDLACIHRSAERGARLAERLLHRDESVPQPQLLDLNAVLVDLGRVLPQLMGPRITVSVEPASRPARVVAELSELEQVVLNLALNAREALAEGGRLVVQAGILYATGEPERVELLVSDDGRGMDELTRARAFEPGFSTRAGGTGLGLPAVAAIVRRAGGSIRCDSTPGRGTSMHVLLPLAEPSVPATQPGALAARFTVLVVDDDAALCSVVTRMLQDGGFAAFVAGNGRLAFEMVSRGGIDLVLCDMLMPEKEGLETISLLRQHWPGLPIIAMSGALRGDSYMGMARKLGAVQTLRKPFGRETLLSAVGAALPVSESVPREGAGAV